MLSAVLSAVPRPFVGLRVILPLRGHFHLFEAPLVDRAVDCDLVLSLEGMRQSLLRREGRVTGSISAEDLAHGRPMEGSLTYREASEGQVLVTAHFSGDDGLDDGPPRSYTLRGFVEVLPVAPLATATTMPFSLYSAEDEELGRGVLRFDLRGDSRRVLGSLRPRLGFATRDAKREGT